MVTIIEMHNFSMNSTEKMLSYPNCRFIFISLRLPVVYLTYSPGYDTPNIPMHIICSLMMANSDWKIAAIMLFLGSTLGNIHSKYAIVYLWISFALDCICWLASLTQRQFTKWHVQLWCQTWNAFVKNGQIFVWNDTYHTKNAQLCGWIKANHSNI